MSSRIPLVQPIIVIEQQTYHHCVVSFQTPIHGLYAFQTRDFQDAVKPEDLSRDPGGVGALPYEMSECVCRGLENRPILKDIFSPKTYLY